MTILFSLAASKQNPPKRQVPQGLPNIIPNESPIANRAAGKKTTFGSKATLYK